MEGFEYTFTDTVKIWQSSSRWHYVTLPAPLSEEVVALSRYHQVKRRGWGAIKVHATLSATLADAGSPPVSWHTSIFPAFDHGLYQLFLKADVRKTASVGAGDSVHVHLQLIF